MVLHFSNKLHHLSKQSIYHTSQAGEQCNGSRQISQSSCEITRIIVLLQLPRLPRRAPEDDMFIKRGNVIECQPRTIATNCFDRLSIYIPVYLPLWFNYLVCCFLRRKPESTYPFISRFPRCKLYHTFASLIQYCLNYNSNAEIVSTPLPWCEIDVRHICWRVGELGARRFRSFNQFYDRNMLHCSHFYYWRGYTNFSVSTLTRSRSFCFLGGIWDFYRRP